MPPPHQASSGEHQLALLQVIGIVLSLVGGDNADPWRSTSFFLRVSDSMHSAYVSISDEDVDLILSDKTQLGQFVYVARLDLASPVPVLHGVKPMPKWQSCIGDPKDLISSDSLLIRTKSRPLGSCGSDGEKGVEDREEGGNEESRDKGEEIGARRVEAEANFDGEWEGGGLGIEDVELGYDAEGLGSEYRS